MSDLQFTDISGETSRTYIFPSGSVKVDGVCRLCVRPSGSHRLETTSGSKYIIAAGWLAVLVEAPAWSV